MTNYKKKYRFFNFLRLLTLISLIIVFLLIIFIFISNVFLSAVSTSSKYELTKPISFLLIGTDYGEERSSSVEGVRADSIMVATLSPKNSRDNIELNLVSIPRDTLVYSTCGSDTGEGFYDKITNTMNYGYSENQNIEDGIACTQNSVENLLNIDIDYYITTSFKGVIDVINAIGGITLDIPYDFCEQNEFDQGGSDCSEGSYVFKKGKQHLSGEEALSFSRQRHLSSDYERNIRQQQVIIATMEKILKNPDKYLDEFVKIFYKDFKTNLPNNELLNFLNFGINLYNDIYDNISKDNNIEVYIKSSIHQNMTDINGSIETSQLDDSYVSNVPLDTYFPNETQNFESDTLAKKVILTKEIMNSPTAPQKKKDDSSNSEDNNIGIEVSAFSAASTEINIDGGAYSYIDYDNLYYTSNLLRLSLGESEADPIFNYSDAGVNQTPVVNNEISPIYNY